MTAPRDFSVERHPGDDGVVVVSVTGDLDYASYTRLEAELTLAADDGPRALVVDLTRVTYCDSCGLRVLLGAAQHQRRLGGAFGLRGTSGQPARALRLTGLDAVLGELGGSDSGPAPADEPTVRA